MPEVSEAGGEPGGGGVAEQEFVIRNDEGFVYKVPAGVYLDGVPSSTRSAAGPDPKAAGLRRRRRALLRLRSKRLREHSRWEALASELAAPLPGPQPPPPPSQSPPASSHPVSAASSSASVIDELLAEVDIQAEFMKHVNQWCDEVIALCDAREAAIVDSMVALPLWGGNPLELVASLGSPDEEAPGDKNVEDVRAAAADADASAVGGRAEGVQVPTADRLQGGSADEGPIVNDGGTGVHADATNDLQGNLDAAAEMIQSSVKKQKMDHGLPPTLTESMMRKRVTNHSCSNDAPQASIESKRKKESGSTSTATGTPGSTKTRKAAPTQTRAPSIVSSLGPVTRRRVAGQKVSPGGSR